MKKIIAMLFICLCLPLSAMAADETTKEKGFWESLVPDNSSAIGIVDKGKSFFGQLFQDTKDTGKTLLDNGKSIVNSTTDKVKDITSGE